MPFVLLMVALAADAAVLKPCSESRPHYLFVQVSETAHTAADAEAVARFAAATKARFTAVDPAEVAAVPKDSSRRTQLAQALANLREVQGRLKKAHSEPAIDSYMAQRDNSVRDVQHFQAERGVALREVVKRTLESARVSGPLILVLSGHGVTCEDGRSWCVETGADKRLSEQEWMETSGARGALFDSSYMAESMRVSVDRLNNRVYARTQGEWDPEESGRGLIATALAELTSGVKDDELCALDENRDGKITLGELGAFLSAAEPKPAAAKEEICIASARPMKCPPKATLAKRKFERFFKHPEVFPPIRRDLEFKE